MTRERPILFSDPMVRAILEDRKTQTRRVVKLGYGDTPNSPMDREFVNVWRTTLGYPASEGKLWAGFGRQDDPVFVAYPYGVAGDVLYVKEASWIWCDKQPNGTTKAGRPRFHYVPVGQHVVYCADSKRPKEPIDGNPRHCWKWKAARFMPRWVSRIALGMTEVRVQRVQEISEEDCIAEGVWSSGDIERARGKGCGCSDRQHQTASQCQYHTLWDSINGKRLGCSWADNPWVWVMSFRRIAL